MPDDTAVISAEEHHFLAPTTAHVLAGLPTSLQIFFDDDLNKRCQQVATYLARAEGFAPRHLIGKQEACFAVVSRALTWRLDPYAVAQATYQTPSGQVGYFGSLCQAIIENSGKLDPAYGGIQFEPYGDWAKVRGKFQIRTNDKGNKYAAATYTPADEVGLGVTVSALLKGESKPRTMEFDLAQAFPRNSTLWATDPATQIRYTAVRRFGSSVVPTLFLGVPFDHDGLDDFTSSLRDVTPERPSPADYNDNDQPRRRGRPSRAATTALPPAPPPEEKPYAFVDALDGVVHEYANADEAVSAFDALLTAAGTHGIAEAIWENGAMLITALREHGRGADADMLNQTYGDIIDQFEVERGERAAMAENPPDPEPEPPPPPIPLPPEMEPEPPQPPPPAPPEPPPVVANALDTELTIPAEKNLAAWFGPARAKIKEMMDARREPEVFKRFRVVNQTMMQRLESEMHGWFVIMDKILISAEGGGK
jgi:hypothetical protein